MFDKYLGLSPEEFGALQRRYFSFQDALNDVSKEPVTVFSPISEKSLAELHLIREVSKDLEKKKQEDMKKAAQKAEEMKETEEKKEEKTEDKTEDNVEEKKPEPEK